MGLKTSGGTVPKRPVREPGKYIVTGSTTVFRQAPGTEFTRLIPEAQEARLIASGAIQRVEPAGDNGGGETTSGSVFVLPECVFNYCPDPDGCKADGCQSPRASDGVAE